MKNSTQFQLFTTGRFEDVKEALVLGLDRIISRVEKGELNRSLQTAVNWYNHFDNCSEEGLRYYLCRIPNWIAKELICEIP